MSSSSGSSSGPSSALGSEPDDVSDSDSASPSGSVSAGSPSASVSSVSSSSSPPSSSSSSPSPSASSSQQDSPVVEEQSPGSSSESASMPAESDSLGSASYDLSSSSSGSGSTSGPSVSETGSSSNGPIEGDGSASPASPPMDDGESGSSESSSHSSSSNPASGSTNVSESSESGTRSDDEGDNESSSDSPPTPPLPVPAEAQQEQEVDFTPPGTPKNKPKKKKGFFSRLFGKKKDKGKENDKPKSKSRKGDKVSLQTLEQDSTSSHELIESPQSHSHSSPGPHHSPSVSPSASASATSNSNSVSDDSPSLSSPIPTPPSTPHGSESSGSSSSSASSSSESPDDEGGEGLVASNVSGEGSEGEVSESVASNSAERTPSSSGSDSVSAKAEVQVSANLEESESLDSPPHSDSVEGDLASAHSSPSTSAVSASLSSGSLSGSSDTGPSDSGSSEEHVDPHSTSSSSSEKVVLAVPLPLSVSGEGSSSSSKDASAKSGSPSPSSSSSTSKSEVSENGDGGGSASASDSDSSSSSSGGEVVDLTESEDPEHDDSSSLPQPRPSVNVHDIEDSNSESPPQVTTPNSPEEIESEEEDTISLPPFKKLSFWGKIRRKFGGKKAEKKRKAKKLGLTYPRVKTQRTPSPPPASPSPRNSPPSDSGPSASSKSGSHESPSLSRSAASGSASAHSSTSSASNSNSTHSSVSGSGVSSGSGTGTPSVSASRSPTTSSSGEGAVGVAVVSVPASDSHSLSSATPSHSGTSLSASASASASPSPSPSPSPSHSTSSASSHIEEGGTTVAVVALPSGSSASASASSSHSSSFSSASASPSASPSASSNHSLSESSASDFGASSSSKISISGAPEDDEEPSIVETITPTPKKNEPLQRDFSFALTIGKLEPSTPVKRRTGAFMRVESHARPSSVSATKKRMKDISRSVSIAGGPRSTRTVVPPTPGKQKSGDFTMSGVVAATHSPGRQGLVRVTSMALREEKERELSGIQKENSSPVGKITPLSTKRRGVSSGPQSPESRERSRKVSVMGESDVNGGKGKGKRGSVAVVDSLKWIPKAEPSPPNELVAASDNWVVEDSKKKLNWFDLFNPRHLNIIETNALRDFENYFEGKSHSNYIGSHGNHGAFLLSVKNDRESVITNEDKPTRAGIAGVRAKLHKEPPKQAFRALLRDREGDTRLWLYTKSLPKTNKAVRVAVSLANDKLEWVKTSRLKRIKAALHQHRLVLLEQKFAQNAIKVGVIYAKSGQKKESAMLANTKGSAEFNDFLGFMGDFVRLKGWKKYAGGLDTENNLTGTHSICTTFEDIEVMFHVSTLLPTPPDDPQCISKKLHIGNDVIVIIWLDDYSAKFKPESLVSKFNHVYIIIQPAESKDLTRSYVRVTVCTKYGVETADPKFPPGTIFERNGMFRQLLLAKIINSEKLAYQSEGFSAMTENIRYQNLFNLYQEYFLKKPTLQQPISRVAGGSSMFTRSLSKKFTHNG